MVRIDGFGAFHREISERVGAVQRNRIDQRRRLHFRQLRDAGQKILIEGQTLRWLRVFRFRQCQVKSKNVVRIKAQINLERVP